MKDEVSREVTSQNSRFDFGAGGWALLQDLANSILIIVVMGNWAYNNLKEKKGVQVSSAFQARMLFFL